MLLWTDGKTHVQLLTEPGRLRLFRDQALVTELKHAAFEADGPLVVDPDGGRVFAGQPLQELRLSDLGPVAEHPLSTGALARLPDGRLVRLISDGLRSRLEIGEADALLSGGATEAIQLVAPQMQRVPQGVCEDEPRPELFGENARLAANAHGITVADGKAGVVALLRPGQDSFAGAWAYPANDQTLLTAEPLADGLLVVPRLGDRDSHVHLIVEGGGFLPLVQWADAAFAAAVGERHIFCMDAHMVVVFAKDQLHEPITHRELTGRAQAVAAGGGRFVVGIEDGLHVLHVLGDAGLAVHTLLVEQRFDLLVRFPDEQPREIEDQLLALGRGGMAVRYMPGGQVEYVVNKVDPEGVDAKRALAEGLGATQVVMRNAAL